MKNVLNRNIKYIILLVPILRGLGPPILKLGFKDMSTFEFGFYRSLIATIAFFIITIINKEYKKIDRKNIVDFIILICMTYLVFQIFLPLGILYTSSGISILIMGLMSVILLVLNIFTKNEKHSFTTILGILLTLIGTSAVILSDKSTGNITLGGLGFMVIALLSYTVFTVRAKKYSSNLSINMILFYVSAFSCVFFFLSSYNDIIVRDFSAISIGTWISIVYYGLFANALSTTIWIWGVIKIGSVKTAVYMNLTPLVAFISGYFLLEEKVTIVQFIGGLIIVLGVFYTQKKNEESPVKAVVVENYQN